MLYELTLRDGTGGTTGQTVYTARNGIVVTSSANVYANSNYFYMGYLFDGVDNSSSPLAYWLTAGGSSVTLDFDFNSILSRLNHIHKMILYPRTREDTISDYRIMGSDNKMLWTELVPRVINTYADTPYGTAREHELNRKFRYIRIELYQKGNWGVTMNGIRIVADVTDDYTDTDLGQAYSQPDNGWRRIEDASPAIIYKIKNQEGGIHYNAEEISFSFVGERLRLVYQYNWGNNGDIVYIDGTAYQTTKINAGSPSLAFSITGLTYGEHNVVIKTYAGNEKYSRFDALELDARGFLPAVLGTQMLAPEPGWQRVNDDRLSFPNGYLVYNNTSIVSNMYGGQSSVLTPVHGHNKIVFKFFGTRIRILACTFPGRSDRIRIRIDNGKEEFFKSNYSTSNIGQVVVYEKWSLEKGVHQAVIDFGDPAPASGGQFFIDAIDIDDDGYILNEVGQSVPVPEPGWKRYRNDHPSFSYLHFSNGWEVNANAYKGVISYDTATPIAKISFKFKGTKLRILSACNTSATRGNNIITVDGVPHTYTEIGQLRYTVLQFEITGLEDKEHTVEITKAENKYLSLEAVDIDENGRLMHVREVLSESGMRVGDRIRCHYECTYPNTVGVFSNLGEETSDFLPKAGTALLPNGDFYLIAVEEDRLGRVKLIADRNIQGGITWRALNDAGLVTGIMLDSVPGKTLVPTITPMTSSEGSGVSLTRSGVLQSQYEAWKMFNGDDSTSESNRWIAPHPAPCWMILSYNRPRIIKAYSVLSRIYNEAAPTAWEIQGSHNGTEWQVLDAQTNVTGLTDMRLFELSNPKPFLFYRWLITANNGYTGWYFTSVDSMQLYEETTSNVTAFVSLPTGGVGVADKDNDWENYVVRSDLGGTSNPGDNKVWNWSNWWSQTINTHSAIGNRTVRGYTGAAGLGAISTADLAAVNTGFRPVFLVAASQKRDNALLCELFVRPRRDFASKLHVYRNDTQDLHYKPIYEDVTVPVSASDWKGYALEVSSVFNADHPPWNMLNNTTAGYGWALGSGDRTGWFIFDYGQPLRIAGYGIGARVTYQAQTPREWTLYGSNDKRNWTLLDTAANLAAWGSGELRKFELHGDANGQMFRYFKMDFGNSLTGTQLAIQEFELYEGYQDSVEQRKSFIDVPFRDDVFSAITVKPHGRMKARVAVAPVYVEHLPSDIQVKWTSDLASHIAVPVYGRMRGTFSVMPPPIVEVNLTPVKDAFVRSNVPRLNYGEEQEIIVGRMMDGEDFNALLQFDIATIPAGQRLKSAKLQLYAEQTSMAGTPIGLYEVETDWAEVGVTWASMPAYGVKFAELGVDKAKAYVEVDVLVMVQGWYSGAAVNNGILLKAEQQTSDVYARFGTRERSAGFRPKLIVQYDDPKVASAGYSDLMGAMVSRQNKSRDIRTSITIKSTWDKKDLQGNLRVLNPMMLESFLTVRRENMHSYMTIKRKDEHRLPSDITVRSRREDVLASAISVSRDFMGGGLTIRRNGDYILTSSITIRRSEVSDVHSDIGVSRLNCVGTIIIVSSSVIPSNITVVGEERSDMPSTIIARQTDSKDVTGMIDVWAGSLLESSITIKSGYIASSLIVPFKGDRDLRTSIRVNERFAGDLTSMLEVIQGSGLPCFITVEIYEDGMYAFIM